jgi:hypothetical protein
MAIAQLDAEGLPGGCDVARLEALHRVIFRFPATWLHP